MKAVRVIALMLVPWLTVAAARARPDDLLLAIAALVSVYGALAVLTRALWLDARQPTLAVAQSPQHARKSRRFELGSALRRLFSGPRHRSPAR